MTQCLVFDKVTKESKEFMPLAAAKKWMRERAKQGREVSGQKFKIYSNGDFVNCGTIELTGSNKSFVANTRQTKEKQTVGFAKIEKLVSKEARKWHGEHEAFGIELRISRGAVAVITKDKGDFPRRKIVGNHGFRLEMPNACDITEAMALTAMIEINRAPTKESDGKC